VALKSEAPQTTLVAEVPVLDPQTTLNAVEVLVFHGRALPQTTEEPLTLEPQTTDVPQTTDEPQTTDTGRTVEFPFVSVIACVTGL
jgi:hypothetical protein